MAQDVDNPLFARVFHRFFGRDRGRGEADLRRELLASASGRVVEVGAGNGINFEHYPASVDELIAVEPEPYLRGQAERAAADARISVRVMPGTAAELDLAPGSADAVVVSGVLCSVPDPGEALAEFRRVLRPGGELRFYEHVRSRRVGFARWQRTVAADLVAADGRLPDRPRHRRSDRSGRLPGRALPGFRVPAGCAALPGHPRGCSGVARAP